MSLNRNAIRLDPTVDELAPVISSNLSVEYPEDTFPPTSKYRVFARLPFSVSRRDVEVDREKMDHLGLELAQPELASNRVWNELTIRRFRFQFTHQVNHEAEEMIGRDDVVRDLHNIAEDHLTHQVQTALEAGTIQETLYGHRVEKSPDDPSIPSPIHRARVGTVSWTLGGVYIDPYPSPGDVEEMSMWDGESR